MQPHEVTEAHLRLLNWHWANLEYGCSASLSQVGGSAGCILGPGMCGWVVGAGGVGERGS
jgi:hypothetical protein